MSVPLYLTDPVTCSFLFYLYSGLYTSLAASSSHPPTVQFSWFFFVDYVFASFINASHTALLSHITPLHVFQVPHSALIISQYPFIRSHPPFPPRYVKLFTLFNSSLDIFTVCLSGLRWYLSDSTTSAFALATTVFVVDLTPVPDDCRISNKSVRTMNSHLQSTHIGAKSTPESNNYAN